MSSHSTEPPSLPSPSLVEEELSGLRSGSASDSGDVEVDGAPTPVPGVTDSAGETVGASSGSADEPVGDSGAGAGAGAGAGDTAAFSVVLFYKYTTVPDVPAFIAHLQALCDSLGLTGRVLVASEGLNGTLSSRRAPSKPDGIDQFIAAMTSNTEQGIDFSDVDWKRSTSSIEPFPELLLKNVRELISTGAARIPPPIDGSGVEAGAHLTPTQFDAALKATPDVEKIIVDVRCSKEYQIGHFDGAVDPKIRTFAEFPRFVHENADTLKDKQVFMYCTGGIRCEKASVLLKSAGIANCYQLAGGIHRYLEAFPDGGQFRGKNFVFDKRVAVGPTEAEAEVVGLCIECKSQRYDQFDPSVVCTVCRELVLVCPPCRSKLASTYHCVDHRHLKDLYFTNLEHFTAEQLEAQRAGLNALLPHTDTKNQRNTLRKQATKIEGRLAELAAGAVPASEPVYKCRTCGDATCSGHCWGFWLEK